MDRKNRYFICLLASGALLYYAVPRISVTAGGAEGIFDIAWLSLALMVISGNLTGLLYTPNKKRRQQTIKRKKEKLVKTRYYN